MKSLLPLLCLVCLVTAGPMRRGLDREQDDSQQSVRRVGRAVSATDGAGLSSVTGLPGTASLANATDFAVPASVTTSPTVTSGPASATLSPSASGSSNSTDAPNQTHVTTSIDAASCSFWMEDIAHQGIAAFNPNPSSYQVFRNVKDFGAAGDGTTDVS